MKFLHLADLHLGKTVNEINMYPDQVYILEEILNIVKEKQADAVVIAGDVYDRSIPSEQAVSLLSSFLTRLADAGVQVYMISGNHDSDERLGFASTLLDARGVHIAGVYAGEVYHDIFHDAYGDVHIWSLPFVKASRVAYFHPELPAETYDAAVRSALSLCPVDTAERNVLIAHQFVVGDSEPEIAGSEIITSESVGTVEKVGADAFSAFDYTALGHIHRPQRVKEETIRYAGSPLKYSLSEIGHNKSVPLVTLHQKGDIEIELIPLHPLHEMRHLKGPIDVLLDPANITDKDDYLWVTLTDEETVPDAISRVKGYYPNVMRLNYENSHTRAISNYDFTVLQEKKDLRELVTDFSRMVTGEELTEEEWQIIRDCAKEAGYETD